MAAETDLAGMRRLVAEHGSRMTPHLVDFITRPWTAEDLTNAVTGRKAVVNRMWRFMRNYDLLLTPTLACPPFGLYVQGPEIIEERMVPPFAWLAFTFPLNMTGQPAASVPAGWTEDGLPVGLQIVGRHLDDPMVLQGRRRLRGRTPLARALARPRLVSRSEPVLDGLATGRERGPPLLRRPRGGAGRSRR